MAIFKNIVEKIPISPEIKIKQKEYLPTGKLPIIDQGQQLIGGYSDDLAYALACDLPVIVFGDHTRCVKYIPFPFAAGADGIKVLKPKDIIIPKYLYYGTQYLVLRLPNRGYARHYQYLEKMDLPVPDISAQEKIICNIEELQSDLDSGVEMMKKTLLLAEAMRQSILKQAFEGRL